MMKKATAVLLGLILFFVSLPACADYGSAGIMISPAVLALVPQSRLTNRFWALPSCYTWSYSASFTRPQERKITEVSGSAATDPKVNTSLAHLKLPGASVYRLSWESGDRPEKVTVCSWKAEVFSHPKQADEYFSGPMNLQADGTLELEPDRVYQFHAVWELSYGQSTEYENYHAFLRQADDRRHCEAMDWCVYAP